MSLPSARELALRAARAAKLTGAVAGSGWRCARLVILCYHGISLDDEHRWNPLLYMPAELFARRMRRLRAGGYHVLPLGEAVRLLYERALPPRSVAVTFDDGFHDFAVRAVPVLNELRLPATNFVATFYSQFARPVFDPASAYLLWKGRGRGTLRLGTVVTGEPDVPIGTAEQREHAWGRLRAHARAERLGAEAKDRLLARLATALHLDYDAFVASRVLQQMQGDELRALPSDLVDVQLHTHRHRLPDDPDAIAREIADNRAALRTMLPDVDGERSLFCYPNGESSPRTAHWLAGLGITGATTTEPGICSLADHPLMLPRVIDTSVQSDAWFEGWLSGLYPGVRRLLRPRRPYARPSPAGPPPAVASQASQASDLPASLTSV